VPGHRLPFAVMRGCESPGKQRSRDPDPPSSTIAHQPLSVVPAGAQSRYLLAATPAAAGLRRFPHLLRSVDAGISSGQRPGFTARVVPDSLSGPGYLTVTAEAG
jgi:hypothetical protein